MINLDELTKIAMSVPSADVHWVPFSTGMDREYMRSFVWLKSHNRTPYIPKEDANFIAAFNPAVCLELIAQLRKAEETLVGICLTYGHAGESIEADYAHVYKMARQCLAEIGDGEK